MTIAIIDDNEVNLALYQRVVAEMSGCAAKTFTSSKAALGWLATNAVDLVVVDYRMPEPDGLEMIRRLRSMNGFRDVPIVMLTGTKERETRLAALDLGANDFLTKPVDKVEFQVRARNLLALHQSRRQLADRAAWLAEEVRKATEQIRARERETIHRLSRLAEYRDDETASHTVRMANFCAVVAKHLGFSEQEQERVLLASPMHDIGKVGIPDDILLKPGKLTPEEWEVMKRHAEIGATILEGSPSDILREAATIAISHHEKYDGTGYPKGLKGEQIPIEGRICAISDVFDALTTKRPYKPAWPVDRALRTIDEGNGAHFDPMVVRAFKQGLDEILELKVRYADERANADRGR
ncbi:response regulator [bacterium]|nr:MAG: response regulator [bacterium]